MVQMPQVPWATGLNSTTDQLAQQLQPGQGFTANGNPTYNGAYNPMFHAANSQPITMKDLASLYYKSQNQGVVGDNPHPFHAANVYNSKFGTAFSPIQTPDDTKDMLQANIAAAPGGRKQVFDALVQSVTNKQATNASSKADPTLLNQTGNKNAASAADLVGNGGASDALTNDGMQKWFTDYVSPYIQEQQANLQYEASMFDEVATSIIPTMDPNKAEIMKAYLPLISQAYHQKADNFATNFLTSNDNASLIGQLMKQKRRNSSILNWLNTQSKDVNNSGGGGDFGSLLAQVTGSK